MTNCRRTAESTLLPYAVVVDQARGAPAVVKNRLFSGTVPIENQLFSTIRATVDYAECGSINSTAT